MAELLEAVAALVCCWEKLFSRDLFAHLDVLAQVVLAQSELESAARE